MKVLEVKNLSLSFNSNNNIKLVLKNISFNLNHGETIGIVGESGSGKTLTALSVLKLLPHNATLTGDYIKFYKENIETDLLNISENEILQHRGCNISMIFQEPMTSLNPSIKCGKQVAEVFLVHKNESNLSARKKVLELFSEVKLPDPKRIYNSYPHQLSGGQKQRVMIAMAIGLKPAILIADEPTTALDVTVQKSILELLKQIQGKYPMSIIFISHDLGLISKIADKIMVMYKGEIVEFGDTKKVISSPDHRYTQGLLKCRPTLHEKPFRLPVLNDFLNPETEKKENSKNDLVMHTKEPILFVNKLTKKYALKTNLLGKVKKELVAVNNISFEVYKGETLGLVGESGSGKSTIGRLITQLIQQNSGQIHYKGISLNNLSKKELKAFHKNVQIIFQDPYSSLNPRITIGNAIMEPMAVHGLYESNTLREHKAKELLNLVKLPEESFNKFPHEFSGGQRQRIVIARALAVNPEFIICDESVSALDVSVQAEILNLLNDFKDEFNLTYIFISHDLAVVKYMSDRIMVLKDGMLVEINETDKLYHSPVSEYTKNLINSIPEIN